MELGQAMPHLIRGYGCPFVTPVKIPARGMKEASSFQLPLPLKSRILLWDSLDNAFQ